MEEDCLRILMLSFPVLAAVAAGVFALLHKRKAALRVVTGGMTTAQITTAMFFIPPVNGAMTALSGFITDKLGRKRSAVVLSGTALVGLVCFICSSGFGMSPVLVGISYGLFIGGLWFAADILFILLPASR